LQPAAARTEYERWHPVAITM